MDVPIIKQLSLNNEEFFPKTMAEAVYYSDGKKLSERNFLEEPFVQGYEIDAILNDIFN